MVLELVGTSQTAWRCSVGIEGGDCKEPLERVDDEAHEVPIVLVCLLWQYWLVVQYRYCCKRQQPTRRPALWVLHSWKSHVTDGFIDTHLDELLCSLPVF